MLKHSMNKVNKIPRNTKENVIICSKNIRSFFRKMVSTEAWIIFYQKRLFSATCNIKTRITIKNDHLSVYENKKICSF